MVPCPLLPESHRDRTVHTLSHIRFLFEQDEIHPGNTVKAARAYVDLAIAELFIQCTCSGILLIGIHAQIRASALCRIALVKADKCRSESAPCRKGIYNERMQHGDA